MMDLFGTIRPILSGLIGGFFVYLLIRLRKGEGKKEGKRKILEYSRGFKIFTIILAPFSIFVADAASHARESQIVLAGLTALSFLSAAVFFVYQVFFIRLSYDNQFIYYKSPIKGLVKAPWSALTVINHSSIMQTDYIIVEGIGKIWCSNMLNGYEAFRFF